MRNILIIDYFFPPLIADWRGVALAKLLPEFGWRPIIVSASETSGYQKDFALLQQVPPGTEVHRVSHPRPAKIRQNLRTRFRVGYDFPDSYRSWIEPAYREAKKILESNRIDLLYSISPTFTTALVAQRLKRESGLPWVADFLDGWAVNDFLHRSLDQSLIRPLARLMKTRIRWGEKSILNAVDKTIVISWHVKERLCELHRVPGDAIEVINDGYDESVHHGLAPAGLYPGKLVITFLGSHYTEFQKPITIFLRAVAEADPAAEVVFVGRCAAPLQEIANKIQSRNVTCVMHLPREKSLSFGLGSSFLFVVMPDYAKWIPTKTYDYLRLGRPILGLVPEDGDAARIIREAKAGFVLPFDPEKMKTALRRIFADWKAGKFREFEPDRKFIEQYERRHLIQRTVEILDQLAPSK